MFKTTSNKAMLNLLIDCCKNFLLSKQHTKNKHSLAQTQEYADRVPCTDLNLYLSSNLSTTTVDGSAIDLFFTAVTAVILIKQ